VSGAVGRCGSWGEGVALSWRWSRQRHAGASRIAAMTCACRRRGGLMSALEVAEAARPPAERVIAPVGRVAVGRRAVCAAAAAPLLDGGSRGPGSATPGWCRRRRRSSRRRAEGCRPGWGAAGPAYCLLALRSSQPLPSAPRRSQRDDVGGRRARRAPTARGARGGGRLVGVLSCARARGRC
jgi:hypothetical protein